MSKRPTWTAKQRAEIFRDNGGMCHICTRKIAKGEDWEIEHPLARGLNGSDKQEDMRPAHIDCHKGKTKADTAIMRKADRQMKSHFGTKIKPKVKFPRPAKPQPVIAHGLSKGEAAHRANMAAKGKIIPPRRFV